MPGRQPRALFARGGAAGPQTVTFEQVVQVTVLSEDRDGDKPLSLRAAALEAGEVDVVCPYDSADVKRTDAMQLYWS